MSTVPRPVVIGIAAVLFFALFVGVQRYLLSKPVNTPVIEVLPSGEQFEYEDSDSPSEVATKTIESPAVETTSPQADTKSILGTLVIDMKSTTFLPIEGISEETAGTLCALAAGQLCLWNGQAIQQTASIAMILDGSHNAFTPIYFLDQNLDHKISFTDPYHENEFYRTFVVTFDVLGRVHNIYEAHITGGDIRGNTITQEWDHEIRFLSDDGRIGIGKLHPQTRFSLVVAGVKSGRFGAIHKLTVPGTKENAAETLDLLSYVPNYRDYFQNWRGAGQAIYDGGEGFDTISYGGTYSSFAFVRATDTPYFLTSVQKDEDGEYFTTGYSKEFSNAVVLVSGIDRVELLLNMEAINFSDRYVLIEDLIRELEANGGIIYGEKGKPEEGIAFF